MRFDHYRLTAPIGFRRRDPRPELPQRPQVSRRWQNRPGTLLDLDRAIAKALVEWGENFDDCNNAFVDQTAYIRARVFTLACERVSDERLAKIILS